MSVEELLHMLDISSPIRNINCGSLRRIGKTQSIKYLIQQKPMGVQGVVLVPNTNIGSHYEEERASGIRIVMAYSSVHNNLRGLGPTYLYADEVPDAEQIVSEMENPHFRFIAGFYSAGRAFDSIESEMTQIASSIIRGRADAPMRLLDATWTLDETDRAQMLERMNDVSFVAPPYPNPEIEELHQQLTTKKIVGFEKIKKEQKLIPDDKNNKLNFIMKS